MATHTIILFIFAASICFIVQDIDGKWVPPCQKVVKRGVETIPDEVTVCQCETKTPSSLKNDVILSDQSEPKSSSIEVSDGPLVQDTHSDFVDNDLLRDYLELIRSQKELPWRLKLEEFKNSKTGKINTLKYKEPTAADIEELLKLDKQITDMIDEIHRNESSISTLGELSSRLGSNDDNKDIPDLEPSPNEQVMSFAQFPAGSSVPSEIIGNITNQNSQLYETLIVRQQSLISDLLRALSELQKQTKNAQNRANFTQLYQNLQAVGSNGVPLLGSLPTDGSNTFPSECNSIPVAQQSRLSAFPVPAILNGNQIYPTVPPNPMREYINASPNPLYNYAAPSVNNNVPQNPFGGFLNIFSPPNNLKQ